MSSVKPKIDLFRERIYPVLFMLVVTAVFIAMVSGIYLATRDSVLRNERLYLKRAVLFAADIAVPSNPVELDGLFSQRIREIPIENAEGANAAAAYYEVLSASGARAGYVIPASGPGLWGEIDAVIGYTGDFTALTGIDFTKQSETPGLGARIDEAWFKEQFRGKIAPFTRVPEGTKTTSPNEFDAITGATITSTAVQNILNETQSQAHLIVGGGR